MSASGTYRTLRTQPRMSAIGGKADIVIRPLSPAKFCWPLGVECFDPLTKVVRLPEPAVAMALKLNCRREGRVFCVVKQLFGGALRERRKVA